MILGASAFALPRKGADAKQTVYQILRFGSQVKTMIFSPNVESAVTWMTFQYAVPDKDLATSNYDSYRRLEGEKVELLL